MKNILFLSIFTAIFAGAQAQPLAETTTTITKGYGNFSIENVKYPLGSVIMNIRSGDTSMVELDFLYQNGLVSAIAPVKKRVKYINGTTGLPFASIGAFRAFYDSFMVGSSSGGGVGPTGPAGADGANGADGINGSDGAAGADGPNTLTTATTTALTKYIIGNGSNVSSIAKIPVGDINASGSLGVTTFLAGNGTWIAPFTLTTTGIGAATFSSGTLNIPTPTAALEPDGTTMQNNGDGTFGINLNNAGLTWNYTTHTLDFSGIGATINYGLIFKNGTASTSGVTKQVSPVMEWLGTGWSGSVSVNEGMRCYFIPGTTATAAMIQFDGIGTGASNNIASLSNLGVWKGGGLNLNTGGTVTMTTTGSNNAAGTATLSSGTVTVSTTAVKTGDIIRINYTSGTALSIGVGNVSTMFTVPTITNATSFVITALTVTGTTNTTDNSSVQWTLTHVQ